MADVDESGQHPVIRAFIEELRDQRARRAALAGTAPGMSWAEQMLARWFAPLTWEDGEVLRKMLAATESLGYPEEQRGGVMFETLQLLGEAHYGEPRRRRAKRPIPRQTKRM